MAVMAVVGGLCVLAVVVLAYVVGRLSGQVRQLSAQLSAATRLSDATGSTSVASPVIAPAPPVAVEAIETVETVETVESVESVESASPADDVPVITGLPDADDDIDITARRVASVTFARPLIKVASLTYGLRRGLDDEHRFRVRYEMRQELRRQRKMRRRRRAGRAPSMGWRA